MNLVIDIGNTQTKAAIFLKDKLIALKVFPSQINVSQLKNFCGKHAKIKSAILCSVINETSEIKKLLKKIFAFVELNDEVKIPIKNLYKTIRTLGNDRLANAVGANHLFLNNNILVIDAGTCIKYDFVSSANEYHGGAISPGIDMRFQALNRFTAKLPLLKKKKIKGLIGQTTEDSIIYGVQNGIITEILGIIALYSLQYKNIKIVLTGGDMQFINSLISEKNSTFAAPNLTLTGLNVILNFNHETAFKYTRAVLVSEKGNR